MDRPYCFIVFRDFSITSGSADLVSTISATSPAISLLKYNTTICWSARMRTIGLGFLLPLTDLSVYRGPTFFGSPITAAASFSEKSSGRVEGEFRWCLRFLDRCLLLSGLTLVLCNSSSPVPLIRDWKGMKRIQWFFSVYANKGRKGYFNRSS